MEMWMMEKRRRIALLPLSDEMLERHMFPDVANFNKFLHAFSIMSP
jgi:hypothetical protein